MHRLALSFVLVGLFACDKADPPGAAATPSAPSAPLAAAAPATPASAPIAAASSASNATATGSFSGKYESKASQLYLPDTKEMKNVKWRGDESPDGLGAGTLSLSIAADGTVTGESTGPLGAMLVNGHAEGDQVTASLLRKSEDAGFTGTLHATRKGGALTGEMSLTRYDASVLRVATFELAAK